MIGARRPFGAPVLAAKTMMRLIAGLTVVVTRREVAELLSTLRGESDSVRRADMRPDAGVFLRADSLTDAQADECRPQRLVAPDGISI